MNQPTEPGHRRALLAKVSRAFYPSNQPKTEIAEAFGIRRFQVARPLDQARETIEIHDPRPGAVETGAAPPSPGS